MFWKWCVFVGMGRWSDGGGATIYTQNAITSPRPFRNGNAFSMCINTALANLRARNSTIRSTYCIFSLLRIQRFIIKLLLFYVLVVGGWGRYGVRRVRPHMCAQQCAVFCTSHNMGWLAGWMGLTVERRYCCDTVPCSTMWRRNFIKHTIIV